MPRLNRFNTEDLSNAPPAFRYERKFHTDLFSLREVEPIVKQHPLLFRKTYPVRTVNNIYVDTEDLACYMDNIEGKSPRLKYRLRWYGDLNSQASPITLEIKRKFDHVGDKIKWLLGCWGGGGDISNEQVRFLLRNVPSGSILHAERLADFKCVLANRYTRQYYVSSNGLFRLTLDHKLSYYAFRYGILDISHEFVDQSVILELKYDKRHEHDAEHITKHIPLRVSKLSKYVRGVELLRRKHFL